MLKECGRLRCRFCPQPAVTTMGLKNEKEEGREKAICRGEKGKRTVGCVPR